MIVADASLLANLLIPGLDPTFAEPIQVIDSDWRAPQLWQYEFKNVLLKYIKSGGITEEKANGLMVHAAQSMKNADSDAPSEDVLSTAIYFGTSSYDAEYLALAQILGVPLITCDRKLAKAAPGIAFLPGDFIGRGSA